MGNKVFYGVIGLIVVIFIGVVIYLGGQDSEKEAELEEINPYDKEVGELTGPTRDTLEDPNYGYNTTYTGLAEKFNNEEDFVAYVWSPTCSFCQQETPNVVEAFKSVNEESEVDFVQINIDEYQQGASNEFYTIEGTPTLLYVEGGEVVNQLVGSQPSVEHYEEFIRSGTNIEE